MKLSFSLVIVIAAYVLSFFHRFAPVSIAAELAQSFNTSATALGVLASTYFYVYTVMQIPTGMLVDTLGTRKVLTAGGILAALGSLLFASALDLNAALWGRTLIGLGVSVTFIAMLKLIALHFPENRFSSLVGLCMLIGNSGSVLAGSPLTTLANTVGWRQVFYGVAGCSLFLGLLSWRLLRDAQPTSQAPFKHQLTSAWQGLTAILKNRATWPAALVNLGMSGSFFAFAGLWAGPWLRQVQDLAAQQASHVVSLYFAGFAVGTLLVGWGSDRLQRRRPIMLLGTHCYAIGWCVIASGVTIPALWLLLCAPLFGVLTASFVLTWACAKEVNPPALSGMSTAVANMGGFSGAAVLLPLVGWIMDQRWQGQLQHGIRLYARADFSSGFLCLLGAALIACLASWFIRETHCRNIYQPLSATTVNHS